VHVDFFDKPWLRALILSSTGCLCMAKAPEGGRVRISKKVDIYPNGA